MIYFVKQVIIYSRSCWPTYRYRLRHRNKRHSKGPRRTTFILLGVLQANKNDCQQVKNISFWICQTLKSREQSTMLTLWKSLVILHLDYWWSPSKRLLISKQLEEAQIFKPLQSGEEKRATPNAFYVVTWMWQTVWWFSPVLTSLFILIMKCSNS